MMSACPTCGLVAEREPYDIGSGPELSCAACEWCWGANGQDLAPLILVRPGPESLEAGRAPGGIVLRVYEVPTCDLLLERCLSRTDDLGAIAERDSDFVFTLTHECCLVAYDGDTGERLPVPDGLRP